MTPQPDSLSAMTRPTDAAEQPEQPPAPPLAPSLAAVALILAALLGIGLGPLLLTPAVDIDSRPYTTRMEDTR